MGRLIPTKPASLLPASAVILLVLLSSCQTLRPIEETEYENFEAAEISPAEIIQRIPGTDRPLQSVKGTGKALVSTPERSDRVTLDFAGNRDTSYISIKNRIGINGGEMMATGDSILVYDKIEQKAHKLSLSEAHLTQINSLASTNVVDVLNYRISPGQIKKVLVNQQYYMLILVDKTQIQIDREEFNIKSVQLASGSKTPYNNIQYEAYTNVNSYNLPQKITITSSDRSSRVTLLIQSLEVNPPKLDLTVDLPAKISVQRL
jgi:hypothetical protein